MEHREIMILLEDTEQAVEFATALREKRIEVEGPEQIDSLDGVAWVSLILVVTPVVAPYIIQLVQALKGSRGKIRRGDMSLDLVNFSSEQLREILRMTDEPKSTAPD